MMRAYRRFSTVQQMSASVGVFVMLALVLESGGLVDWGQRLDLGTERTIALPVVMALHRGLGWMGMERVRRDELMELARIGWSDDPKELELARARRPMTPVRPIAGQVTESFPATAKVAQPAMAASIPRERLKPMAGDPPLLSKLPEIPPVEAGGTRTVALVGDSMMAVGLSSTLLREAPRYPDLVLVKMFKSGTGLARPEVFDWQTEYPAMLGEEHPDFVIVAIGANDGQGFVEEGVTYPFGSPGWTAIYERRVQAFLAMLESDGATVVWVGLPPMKSDAYDARIALVNRIDYAVVSASPQAIWYSTAGIVGDGSGKFQDYGQVRGETARLRQQDGIHLSDDGAVLVVAKLLPWLAVQQQSPAQQQTIQPASKQVAKQ
jgi:hypothetical protein